jgi:hypothetical protein
MRRFLIRAAYGIGFALWILLWIEIGLQGFYYATAHQFLFARAAIPIFAPNRYCGFFNQTNLSYSHRTNEFAMAIYTNSQGLRVARPGTEYSTAKAPGTLRILLLGPSFAFGWGVNYQDTAAARLEGLLKPYLKSGSKVEVIDAGVPSLPAPSQLKWFEHAGCSFKPDWVVQFIYGSMIVDPDDGAGLYVDKAGYLENRLMTPREWLFEHAKKSAIVFYGWTLYTRWFAAHSGAIAGAGRHLDQTAAFSPGSSDVKTSMDYYRELGAAVAKCGAKLSIIYFPLSYCVHRDDMARWRHLGVSDDIDGQIAADRDFCDYLGKQGFDCLNLTPDLVEAAAESPKRLYYWLDIHWTPRGNAVVADSISKHLANKYLDGGR